LTIPLEIHGVISGFPTKKPTNVEVETLPRIELTNPTEWDPYSDYFADAERAREHKQGLSVSGVSSSPRAALQSPDRLISALSINELVKESSLVMLDDGEDLYDRIVSCVHVSPDDISGDGIEGHLEQDVYADHEQRRTIAAMKGSDRASVITPEILSRRWFIGLDTAKRTLQVTTQAGVRNVLVPAERKMRKKAPWLKFPSLSGKFYSDLMFSRLPSVHGDKGASIFTNGMGYDRIYPWRLRSEHPEAIMSFIHDVGVPQTLVSDGGKELFEGRSRDVCKEYHIDMKITVPYSPWQNLAEAAIREIKRGTRRVHRRTGAHPRVWTYAAAWVTDIRRYTALDIAQLDGQVPATKVTGSTPDISQLALFDFYQPVHYFTPTIIFPGEKKLIGRWLGLAKTCTDPMSFYILTETGHIIIRKDVWDIPVDDAKTAKFQADLLDLDSCISSELGDIKNWPSNPKKLKGLPELPLPPDDLFEEDEPLEPFDSELASADADEYTPESYDEYISAQVVLPVGGESKMATVVGRKHDKDGRPVGTRNSNPILDSRMYEVEFPDGSTDAFTANTIAEAIYGQVDNEGRQHQVLSEITDHRTNDKAVPKGQGTYVTTNGTTRNKFTTAGWELQVEWKDGSSSWIPLKDLKDSNPIEVAEYAVANKIAEEPAFVWWVRQFLRKRDRIIKKVKTRYWKRTHKFGIELPKTVEEALRIDEETGTDYWRKAIEKEMRNVMPAFEFRDDNVVPIGYKHIDCHLVFDIKADLTRKARYVAGGHQTDPPKDSVYSSVVSRDSVRIAFTIAALNDLDILAGDVQNAYLNAPTKERCYTTAGLEFGPDNKGRPVLIVRALYGLKSSGARWRDHMAATLRDAGFDSCLADPDVWMRPNVKPDGFKYWEYVLCYVDDVLVISHEPMVTMDFLSSRYTMKEGSVKEPDSYLGAEVRKFQIPGVEKPRWAMSSDLYVQRAIADVETELSKTNQYLKAKVTTPMVVGYRAELDVSMELDPRRANYYQGLIGVLRWIVELGRVDILMPVSILSRYLAMPRRGHLEQVLHVYAYLKRYNKSALVFDDTTPHFDPARFTTPDWSQFYPGAAETLPPNMPEERGNAVTTTCYVDADHAGCHVTRRSHTGILIFMNKAPIIWYSKRQNTVESSTFGSEFIAMKTAIDQVEALRYKLRMMGIPLDGSTSVFCDNESVFKNATHPESTLKKKHNAIAYHRTREAQAAGMVRIAWQPGETNLADLFTKLLPGPRLRELVGFILW
jgi:hypothetical protein